MGIASVDGRAGSGDRAYRDDFPEALLFHDRGDRVAPIHGPEPVHFRDKL